LGKAEPLEGVVFSDGVILAIATDPSRDDVVRALGKLDGSIPEVRYAPIFLIGYVAHAIKYLVGFLDHGETII